MRTLSPWMRQTTSLLRFTGGRTITLRRSFGVSAHRFGSDSQAKSSLPKGSVPEGVKEDPSVKSGIPEEGQAVHEPLATIPTPDLFSLKDQTIIVTGGGRGLGLTIATSILESGGNVACVDLLPEPSKEEWDIAMKTAEKRGKSITYHSVNVTDQSLVQQTFSTIFKESSSPVRGLFCAAGIQKLCPAVEFTDESFRKIIDVNLTGSFFCAQSFAIEFMKHNPVNPSDKGQKVNDPPSKGRPGSDPSTGLAIKGGASIVLTGSMSGHIANYGLEAAAYNASKAGVNQLVKNLAMEWGKKGIRVNSISPGYIRTAMTSALLDQQPELNDIWLRGSLLGRLSTPDEYRGPVVFLLSDASSFMTGADILIDGGHTAT